MNGSAPCSTPRIACSRMRSPGGSGPPRSRTDRHCPPARKSQPTGTATVRCPEDQVWGAASLLRSWTTRKPAPFGQQGLHAAGVFLKPGWPETGSMSGRVRRAAAPARRLADRSNALARTVRRDAGRGCAETRKAAFAPRAENSRKNRHRSAAALPRRLDAAHQRLAPMLRELRAEAGPRHRVPLVTIAAGVEHQRPVLEHRISAAGVGGLADQPRFAVRGWDSALVLRTARPPHRNGAMSS